MQIFIIIIILFGCYFLFFNADIRKTAKICLLALLLAAVLGVFLGIIRATTLEISMVVVLLFLLRQAFLEI